MRVAFIQLMMILLLTACNYNTSPTTVTIEPNLSETVESQLSPILTSKAQTTDTPRPTPTKTATETYLPTLSTKEAQIELLTLLSNNGNCRLPCLWGIIPGETTIRKAINRLEPFSGISSLTVFDDTHGTIRPQYKESDLTIDLFIVYFSKNTIITTISLRSQAIDKGSVVFNSIKYGEILAYYSLSHILDEYGRPSSVLINTQGGPYPWGDLGSFNVLLFYPDQGIVINYQTIMRIVGTNVLGCLDNAQIDVDLYPSGNGDSFMSLISPNWNDRLPLYRPLEEVSFISIDQFYKTFLKSTNKCLSTPIKYWPTIEPGGQ